MGTHNEPLLPYVHPKWGHSTRLYTPNTPNPPPQDPEITGLWPYLGGAHALITGHGDAHHVYAHHYVRIRIPLVHHGVYGEPIKGYTMYTMCTPWYTPSLHHGIRGHKVYGRVWIRGGQQGHHPKWPDWGTPIQRMDPKMAPFMT